MSEGLSGGRLLLVAGILFAVVFLLVGLKTLGLPIPLLSDGAAGESMGESGGPLLPEEFLLADPEDVELRLEEDEAVAIGNGKGGRDPFATPSGGSITGDPEDATGPDAPRGRDLTAAGGSLRDPLVDQLKAGLDPKDPGALMAFLIGTFTPKGTKLGPEDVEMLFAALAEHDDFGVQNLLLAHLTRIESPDVSGRLLTFLEERRPHELAVRVMDVLTTRNDRAAVEGMVALLAADDRRGLRRAALERIAKMNGDLATEPLLDLYRNGADPASRGGAVLALARVGGAKGAEVVVELAESADDQSQRFGRRALREVNSPEAVPVLADALRTATDAGYRRELVEALGRTGSEEAVDPLVGVAVGRDPLPVRADAIRNLAALGSETALPALRQVGADPESQVRIRQMASQAVTRIEKEAARRAEREARR